MTPIAMASIRRVDCNDLCPQRRDDLHARCCDLRHAASVRRGLRGRRHLRDRAMLAESAVLDTCRAEGTRRSTIG